MTPARTAGAPERATRAQGGAPVLLALAELRLLLLRRRLSGRGGVVEIVARVALFAVAIPAGIVFAALSGAGAWRAVRAGVGLAAELPVAALLFGVWQTWTAVALSVSDRDALDMRRLLGYPVPPARVFAYGLGASVVGDPFALFWCLMLAGAFAGAALARPGPWLLALAAAYFSFVLATTALVALVQELLARLLRGRRLREMAIAAVYVGTAFLVFFMTSGPRSALRTVRLLSHVRWFAYPPALAERAISALYAQRDGAAAAWLALLALAAAATAWAAYRLALSAARSGGGEGLRAAPGATRGWGLPGRLGALLEKEGKYLLRHPVVSVLAVVVPALAALVAWGLSPRIPEESGEVVRALPFLGFALYPHLATQPFWLNAFGWERGGGRTWFLAPVRTRDVLLAKNAAACGLSFALFAAASAAGVAVGRAPPGWALAGGFALHAGIAPFLLAAGNLVSILNPRPAPHTVQRGGHLSPVSSLAGMAVFSAASGLFAIPVLGAVRLDEPWLLPASWTALGLAGIALYAVTLPRAARLLELRREPLLAAVCGDDV